MLTDDDAQEVLDYLREQVNDCGYADFDAFAVELIAAEDAAGQNAPTASTLLRYIDLVQGLLERIGKRELDKAKRDIATVLELDNGIEIELDLSAMRHLRGPNAPIRVPLDADPVADRLAYGLQVLRSSVDHYQYPDPPSPGPGTKP